MTAGVHHGDLRVLTSEEAVQYAGVEGVTGYLYINADAQFPALTRVGGSLYINADAQFPALTRVGGSLCIRADAQLLALTSIGGSLHINDDAQLPALTSVDGRPATKQPIYSADLTWPVCILDYHMRIGCQIHSLYDWARFDYRRIAEMAGHRGVQFWSDHKAQILQRARDAGRL